MPMTTRFALPFALLSLLPYAAAAQQSAQNPGTQYQNVLEFPAHDGPIEVVLNEQRAQTVFQTIVKMAGLNVIFDAAFDEAQAGALVSVHISAASLRDALDQAAARTNTYWRPAGQNTILVTPYEPGKERAVPDRKSVV